MVHRVSNAFLSSKKNYGANLTLVDILKAQLSVASSSVVTVE